MIDLGKLASDGMTIVENAMKAAPGSSVVTMAIDDAAALKDILAQLVANAPAIDAPALDPNDRHDVDAEIAAEEAKE